MTLHAIDRGIEYILMILAMTILIADLNHILEYVFIGLAVVVLTRQAVSHDRRVTRTSLDLPIVLYLGWILISIGSATDPSYSFSEWRKLLAHVVMFFLIVNFITSERQVKQILGAFIVGVLLMSLYGIIEFFAAEGSLVKQWHERAIRADSLTAEYNWLSTYLLMGLPVSVVWAMYTEHREWRVLLIITSVIALFTLFITYTRAAWLAVAIQACVLIVIRNPKIIKPVVGIIIGSLSILMLAIIFDAHKNMTPASMTIIPDRNTMSVSSLVCRLHIWELGVKDIIEHPLTGWGYGTKTFAKKYHDIHVLQCLPHLHNIHNSYLSFAFGAGIPAMCFFVWIFVHVLSTLWSGHLHGLSEFQRMLALGLLLMTVGLMIRISFDVMFIGMLAVLFWMLIGLFFGLQRPSVLPILRKQFRNIA